MIYKMYNDKRRQQFGHNACSTDSFAPEHDAKAEDVDLGVRSYTQY